MGYLFVVLAGDREEGGVLVALALETELECVVKVVFVLVEESRLFAIVVFLKRVLGICPEALDAVVARLPKRCYL